jgi:triosephosphate isomerase
MRKKIVPANWKMKMTQAESAAFIKSLLLEIGDMADVEVVIIPAVYGQSQGGYRAASLTAERSGEVHAS